MIGNSALFAVLEPLVEGFPDFLVWALVFAWLAVFSEPERADDRGEALHQRFMAYLSASRVILCQSSRAGGGRWRCWRQWSW